MQHSSPLHCWLLNCHAESPGCCFLFSLFCLCAASRSCLWTSLPQGTWLIPHTWECVLWGSSQIGLVNAFYALSGCYTSLGERTCPIPITAVGHLGGSDSLRLIVFPCRPCSYLQKKHWTRSDAGGRSFMKIRKVQAPTRCLGARHSWHGLVTLCHSAPTWWGGVHGIRDWTLAEVIDGKVMLFAFIQWLYQFVCQGQ